MFLLLVYLVYPGECPEKFQSSFVVCACGVDFGWKTAEVFATCVQLYSSNPALFFLIPRNAFVTAATSAPLRLISQILAPRGRSEIAAPVVQSIRINVVNLQIRLKNTVMHIFTTARPTGHVPSGIPRVRALGIMSIPLMPVKLLEVRSVNYRDLALCQLYFSKCIQEICRI